jgi:D-alanyl-D-alanine carboxypeptidase (penicillin-binding protein 5/6)
LANCAGIHQLFTDELNAYLLESGYAKTRLFNDPSGASTQADTHMDDINRVALKLLHYDVVRTCVGSSAFAIDTPQGRFEWHNTNELLDEHGL